VSEVRPLPTLGALFYTVEGARRVRERPRGAHLFSTVVTEDGKPDVVYLAHWGGGGGTNPGHRWGWGSTALHTVLSTEPVTLDPSIGWQDCCGRHGFVREGVWHPTADSVEP
jgi:hypothetical protein